jgi:insulysin
MSMMGSEKYPIENEYAKHLAAHSGELFAQTDGTSTEYFFEMASSGDVYGVLDRFSQLFLRPLFLPSVLNRELKAIDSEHRLYLPNEARRVDQVQRSTSNPNHPWSNFETGTLDSLKTTPEARGVNVRDAIIDFHDKEYSSNRMKFVILGPEPLDELEKWTTELFAGILNKNLPQNYWDTEVPFRPKDLGTQCFVKAISDWEWMDLDFLFLDETLLFESQPSRYICHLLQHRGYGSIFSHLDSKGWVTGVMATVDPVCIRTPGILSWRIHLTETGLREYREVAMVFYNYVSLLRKTPPQEWIFEEIKTQADIDFKFMEKKTDAHFTRDIGRSMQMPIPRDQLLSGHSR